METEVEAQISAILKRRSPPPSLAYGVPKTLRKLNKEAYTPQAVSIGPLHYGEPYLQPMKPNKEHYFKCFFDRTAADKNTYYKMVRGYWESGQADEYYQGKVKLSSSEFVRMLLVDGIFIIEFFLRLCLRKEVEENDDIFKTDLLRDDIFHDVLILLENQLPFDVLKNLYDSSNNDLKWEDLLFLTATEWFKRGVNFDKVKETSKRHDVRHLTGFLQALCVVSIPRVKPKLPNGGRQNFERPRSATELQKAGVDFIVPPDRLPFDLKFTDGKLEFPVIIVDRWTELSFRNLIAHEHCLHKDKLISSYIILMGSLLKTPADVDLLVEKKIIDNRSLASSEEVCALIKNLYSKRMMDKSEFYYTDLCEDLKAYSKDTWHQWEASFYNWRETLKDEYFSNPWTIISVVGAFVVLVLTIIQTVCSVIAVRWG